MHILYTLLLALILQGFFAYFIFNLSPKTYFKRCLVSVDQLFNTILFFGYEDETLSSRAYRLSQYENNHDVKWYYKLPAFIINCLFFFDYETIYDEFSDGKNIFLGKKYHCELSFLSERERLQMPPELRKVGK